MMGAPEGGAPSAVMRAYGVFGRVQGVGFREWTRRSAERLGLAGSVRNRPDGSVEIHAIGSEEALTQLQEMLQKGPPAARVDRIERLTPDAGMPRTGFRISH